MCPANSGTVEMVRPAHPTMTFSSVRSNEWESSHKRPLYIQLHCNPIGFCIVLKFIYSETGSASTTMKTSIKTFNKYFQVPCTYQPHCLVGHISCECHYPALLIMIVWWWRKAINKIQIGIRVRNEKTQAAIRENYGNDSAALEGLAYDMGRRNSFSKQER